MGYKIAASCECGYTDEFRVGGNRSSYLTESFFPHYCGKCGLVSANIARRKEKLTLKEKFLAHFRCSNKSKAKTEESVNCPTCNSNDIKQYGKKPMTCDDQIEDKIRWFNLSLDTKNNFCPECKRHTLDFEIAAYFD